MVLSLKKVIYIFKEIKKVVLLQLKSKINLAMFLLIEILFFVVLVSTIVGIVRIVREKRELKRLTSSNNPTLYIKAAKQYESDGKYKKAFELYEKAAQGGEAEALYELSCCYDESKGCARDNNKAFQLCLSAAEKGVERAQFRIGCCYEKGIGTEIDLDKALFWYEEALKNGNRIVAPKIKRLRSATTTE